MWLLQWNRSRLELRLLLTGGGIRLIGWLGEVIEARCVQVERRWTERGFHVDTAVYGCIDWEARYAVVCGTSAAALRVQRAQHEVAMQRRRRKAAIEQEGRI